MTDEQTLEMKRIVWAYMIEEGNVTFDDWRNWNVYGANYEYPPNPGKSLGYCNDGAKKYWDNLLHDSIHKVGIDWDKTQMPKADRHSEFQGTFTENTPVETLIGDLYFKDGSKLTIGTGHAEKRFIGYAQALTGLIDDKARVKKIFGER